MFIWKNMAPSYKYIDIYKTSRTSIVIYVSFLIYLTKILKNLYVKFDWDLFLEKLRRAFHFFI